MGGREQSGGRSAGIWVAVTWLGVVLITVGLVWLTPSWWWQLLIGISRGVTKYWPSTSLIVAGLACLVAYRLRPTGPSRRATVLIAGRFSLFEHVVLLLGLAVGFGVVLAGLLWWALGQPELTIGQAWTTRNTFDALKIVLLVVAGIGGVVALTVSYRKQRLGENAEHREATRLFTERYNRAAELLGSNDAAARTAGTYAIAGLADDWIQGRQICINVLCACRRLPNWPAIIDPIIAAHLQPGAEPNWQGHAFDLSGVNHLNLSGIEVATGTTLVLSGGTLAGTRLTGGTVKILRQSGALDFGFARFYSGRADFSKITIAMHTTNFRNAVFSGAEVSFYDATVERFGPQYCGALDFGSAMFSGGRVDFSKITITDGIIDFEGADFTGGRVCFSGATLSGGKVDFAKATFLAGKVDFHWASFSGSEVRFHDANFRGGTVDLSRPAVWSRPPEGLLGSERNVFLPPAEGGGSDADH